MKRSWGHNQRLGGIRNLLAGSALILAMLGMAFGEALSATPQDLAECAKIEDDGERLKCYNKATSRQSGNMATVKEPAEKISEKKEEKSSYFSRLWELNPEFRTGKYPFSPYRSNYILPFTYNDSPNTAAVQEADPSKGLKNAEVVFQLSLKVKLWQDIFGKEMDLWFGYTQRSFWQFYNFEDSSPFRETNYEPELLFNFRTDYNILGWRGRFLNVGFNHQSNGQSEPLSKSWNRLVANVGWEKNRLSLLLRGWYRFPESAEKDDNPHMEKYLGYGEIWAYYFWKNHRLGIMLRNNLDFQANRGALQAEWSFPLFERVSGYLQYFVGYGESLLDYNHSVNRIGIGVLLTDWN